MKFFKTWQRLVNPYPVLKQTLNALYWVGRIRFLASLRLTFSKLPIPIVFVREFLTIKMINGRSMQVCNLSASVVCCSTLTQTTFLPASQRSTQTRLSGEMWCSLTVLALARLADGTERMSLHSSMTSSTYTTQDFACIHSFYEQISHRSKDIIGEANRRPRRGHRENATTIPRCRGCDPTWTRLGRRFEHPCSLLKTSLTRYCPQAMNRFTQRIAIGLDL